MQWLHPENSCGEMSFPNTWPVPLSIRGVFHADIQTSAIVGTVFYTSDVIIWKVPLSIQGEQAAALEGYSILTTTTTSTTKKAEQKFPSLQEP